jgi:lambda repressor-like predicted transcriptional regulator
MADRYLDHRDRCERVVAALETNGWSWFRLAKEMGIDYTTVRRNLDWTWRKKENACADPRLSLIRCLARATNTSIAFWTDRKVG